eukprot:1158343-Pelagomonas_calceolata.AAC.2
MAVQYHRSLSLVTCMCICEHIQDARRWWGGPQELTAMMWQALIMLRGSHARTYTCMSSAAGLH